MQRSAEIPIRALRNGEYTFRSSCIALLEYVYTYRRECVCTYVRTFVRKRRPPCHNRPGRNVHADCGARTPGGMCSLRPELRRAEWLGVGVRIQLFNLSCPTMETNERRPRLSTYARQRTRELLSEGLSCSEIVTALKQEGITTCRQTVWRLEKHIEVYGTISPLSKSGRPTKITSEALRRIDTA